MSDNPLEVIPVLSPEKRQKAHEQACELVVRKAGNKPEWKMYESRNVGRYPRWIVTLTTTLIVLLLAAAFSISMFRLFTAGRDHFAEGIPGEPVQAGIAGIAVFLMAEISVVLATIVQKVLFDGKNHFFLTMMIVLGGVIATAGNVVVAAPKDGNFFGWVETLSPPAFVLGTALILKRLMFKSIEHWAENQAEYKADLELWESRVKNPESDASFQQIYGNMLKDAIIKEFVVGAKAKERREYILSLNRHDWVDLIVREFQEDKWIPNIVLETDQVVVEAQGRVEVGPNKTPLPQPSYGFQTEKSNHSTQNQS